MPEWHLLIITVFVIANDHTRSSGRIAYLLVYDIGCLCPVFKEATKLQLPDVLHSGQNIAVLYVNVPWGTSSVPDVAGGINSGIYDGKIIEATECPVCHL